MILQFALIKQLKVLNLRSHKEISGLFQFTDYYKLKNVSQSY